MTFVLGFYVSLIVTRWWDQYNLLPWPDSLAIYIGEEIFKKFVKNLFYRRNNIYILFPFIVGLIHGLDERGRLMRRNIMRYVLLSYVITLRRVSRR